MDEAGRGPLAGPVVAAAVILERRRIPKGPQQFQAADARKTREEAFPRIMEMAVAVGVGEASVDEIDLVNIRQATHLAMARAVRALDVARRLSRWWTAMTRRPCPAPATRWSDGDGRSVSIAAASIIAKVTRDRMMAALHDEHPGYGWRSNKGYGTRRASGGAQAARRDRASPPQLRPHPQHLVWPQIWYGLNPGTQS